MSLTPQDIASTERVNKALTAAFVRVGSTIIVPFANDPVISPLGMLLGIVQSHVDGLASALVTLEPTTREQLIDTIPAQLRAIIERSEG